MEIIDIFREVPETTTDRHVAVDKRGNLHIIYESFTGVYNISYKESAFTTQIE